jgi:hypothetical protein
MLVKPSRFGSRHVHPRFGFRIPKTVGLAALAAASFLLFAGVARRRASEPPPPVGPVSEQRSFIISDQLLLQNFTFQRVLDQLVARSGVPGLTSSQLYRQWFDTQNLKPGLFDASAPHCDDFIVNGAPSFNGIPRRCPTAEGAFAGSPYAPDEYIPIAVINRFDLAPPDGSNCGQYRMVFARKATTPTGKLHIIFEAVLPNPHPEVGLSGCRNAAAFWANLSGQESASARRDQLEAFFFTGTAGYGPVIDPSNYDGSANQSGIRTLEFGGDALRPRFYQFRLKKSCAGDTCMLRMSPDVLENMPFGGYFDGHDTSDTARTLRDSFVSQVGPLAVDDVNLFEMHLPATYLMAESDPLADRTAFDPFSGFNRGLNTPDGADFNARIQTELQRIGSNRTVLQIMLRAAMRGCEGCHNGAPPGVAGGDPVLSRFFGTFVFQMFDESRLVPGPDGPRYQVAGVIENTFMPHRIAILRDFLTNGTAPVHSN